jgi:hypothetical protein
VNALSGQITASLPTLHLGFTGTRNGMIMIQRATVERVVRDLASRHSLVVHHGDCVGADMQFHELAIAVRATIVIHPPLDLRYRANCVGDDMRPPRPYLRRNQDIVIASEHLIAAPKESTVQWRGGTWFTYRAAHERRVRTSLVLPDGSVKDQQWAAWKRGTPI